MATYRDVEMLQGSMQSLTDVLLRKRMLEQQERERTKEEALRREMMGYQRERDATQENRQTRQEQTQDQRHADDMAWREKQDTTAERRHQETLGRHDAELERRLQDEQDTKALQAELRRNTATMQQVAQINAAVDNIRQGVANGVISHEDGNAQMKAMHRQLRLAGEALVGMTPLAVFNENPDANVFQGKPVAPEKPPVDPNLGNLKTEIEPGQTFTRKAHKSEIEYEKTLPKLKDEARQIKTELDSDMKFLGPMEAEYRKKLEETLTANLAKQMAINQAYAIYKAKAGKPTAAPAPAVATAAPGQTVSTSEPLAAGVPKVGEVRKGYKFIGGDPAKPTSWEKMP